VQRISVRPHLIQWALYQARREMKGNQFMITDIGRKTRIRIQISKLIQVQYQIHLYKRKSRNNLSATSMPHKTRLTSEINTRLLAHCASTFMTSKRRQVICLIKAKNRVHKIKISSEKVQEKVHSDLPQLDLNPQKPLLTNQHAARLEIERAPRFPKTREDTARGLNLRKM
jgi:hypothetical protein